jgi:hypothetical protein
LRSSQSRLDSNRIPTSRLDSQRLTPARLPFSRKRRSCS